MFSIDLQGICSGRWKHAFIYLFIYFNRGRISPTVGRIFKLSLDATFVSQQQGKENSISPSVSGYLTMHTSITLDTYRVLLSGNSFKHKQCAIVTFGSRKKEFSECFLLHVIHAHNAVTLQKFSTGKMPNRRFF